MSHEFDYRIYPILLVDDEVSVLQTLGGFLKEFFQIETTDDPRQALEMIQAKEYAVIISDQRMPGMRGSDLLARVRQLSEETIRILITGYTDLEAAIESINKGEIYRYITKQDSAENKEIFIKQAIDLYHIGKEKKRLEQENEQMLKKLAVQQKLSVIGHFGLRLNEWLSSLLGTIEKHKDNKSSDAAFVKQISRLKSLMQKIEQVYRQTDFDIPRLRRQMEFDDLNEIITLSVDYTMAFVKRGIREDWQSIRVITMLDNNLPGLYIARGPVQIAIEELLINAKQSIEEKRLDRISYSEEGKIEIKTWYEKYQKGGRIYVEVSDNGCGIMPEHIEDIFKPLIGFSKYPVDRPGLGLNIVEQVMTFHDGYISVDSKPCLGSKFTLAFPL